MEQRADAVAAVALDHGALTLRRDLGDLLAYVPVPSPGLHRLDAPLQALVRRHAQVLGLVVDVPDEHRLVEVAVVAVDVRGDVHVEDIPALQRPGVGDAVADDLVDAGAARLWKVVVVERRRVPPVRGDVRVADLVELLGGDPGPGGADGGIQRAARHLAALSKDVDLPRLVLHRHLLLLRLNLRRGLGIFVVVGDRDVGREVPQVEGIARGHDGVGSERARVAERGHLLRSGPAAGEAVHPRLIFGWILRGGLWGHGPHRRSRGVHHGIVDRARDVPPRRDRVPRTPHHVRAARERHGNQRAEPFGRVGGGAHAPHHLHVLRSQPAPDGALLIPDAHEPGLGGDGLEPLLRGPVLGHPENGAEGLDALERRLEEQRPDGRVHAHRRREVTVGEGGEKIGRRRGGFGSLGAQGVVHGGSNLSRRDSSERFSSASRRVSFVVLRGQVQGGGAL